MFRFLTGRSWGIGLQGRMNSGQIAGTSFQILSECLRYNAVHYEVNGEVYCLHHITYYQCDSEPKVPNFVNSVGVKVHEKTDEKRRKNKQHMKYDDSD